MQRQRGKVQNPRGKPFGFIGVTDARKATVHLDLCACHDLPPCHIMGYAHVIPILSLRRSAGCFTSLGGLGPLPAKGIWVKKHFSNPPGPRSSRASPSMVSMTIPRHPYDKGWSHKWPNSSTQASSESWPMIESQPS